MSSPLESGGGGAKRPAQRAAKQSGPSPSTATTNVLGDNNDQVKHGRKCQQATTTITCEPHQTATPTLFLDLVIVRPHPQILWMVDRLHLASHSTPERHSAVVVCMDPIGNHGDFSWPLALSWPKYQWGHLPGLTDCTASDPPALHFRVDTARGLATRSHPNHPKETQRMNEA